MVEQTLNRVELIGRIGTDPRILYTEDKQKYVRLSVATNEILRNASGELREETTWHRVTAWEGRDVPNLDTLKKGARVRIVGRIRQSSYEKDGQQKYFYEIVAGTLEELASNPK